MLIKYSKLLLLAVIMSFSALQTAQLPLSDYAEKKSAGRLSENLENRIATILESFKVKNIPHIRKISEALLQSDPAGYYDVLQKFSCYYINEEFFANLTDDELRASLAYTVYKPEAMQIRAAQKLTTSTTGATISWLTYISTLVYLDAYYPAISWQRKLLSCGATSLSVSAAAGLVNRSLTSNDIYYYDNYVCRKAQCRDGLIGLLKKFYAADKVLFNKDDLTKRIAQLQNNI
ncbi:hypothetical protein H0X48_00605 [Candidatus Dependentiae bacterium]|nr:hypothetical protein [Candidatus Dependentiae bacterium]